MRRLGLRLEIPLREARSTWNSKQWVDLATASRVPTEVRSTQHSKGQACWYTRGRVPPASPLVPNCFQVVGLLLFNNIEMYVQHTFALLIPPLQQHS